MQSKFLFLFSLFLLFLFLNLSLGSVLIPFKDLQNLILEPNVNNIYSVILWDYRIPKLLALILTGVSLSISGLLMQTLFRNPIVGPYVLGLSSGAGLSVALMILGASIFSINLGEISITLAAAMGSILSLLIILLLYYQLKNPSSLLISGLMIGIFSGAIVSIMSYFTKAENLQKYIFWSMGNMGNLSNSQLLIFFITVFFALIALIFLIKPLNALLLGEEYARSLGISLKKTHLLILLVTGILTGVVTAMVGPIAFVGLMVPHLSRMFFRTNLHQILIPAVLLVGAVLMLFFDTIAQIPGSNITLPINSITAMFGAPMVIFLILRK